MESKGREQPPGKGVSVVSTEEEHAKLIPGAITGKKGKKEKEKRSHQPSTRYWYVCSPCSVRSRKFLLA